MPQGTVKWFNNAKGFGFIIEDGESEDLFAHFSSIQMEGYKTLKAGQAVHFEKQPGDKGFHAVNITAVTQSSSSPSPNIHSVDHNEFISVDEAPANFQEQTVKHDAIEQTQDAKATDKTFSA